MERKQVGSLTGLRGLAAILVMFYHFRLYDHVGGWLQTAIKHGYLSVDLFFVLSGFVMSLTYREMFLRGYGIKLHLRFLGLRLARIYPIYAVVTIATIAVKVGVHGSQAVVHAREIIGNALLIQNWGLCESIVGPSWSISVEWALYLIFPFLTLIALLRRPKFGVLLGISSICCLFILAYAPQASLGIARYKGPLDIVNPLDPGSLLRGAAEFSLGMLAWRVWQSGTMKVLVKKNWPLNLVLTLLAITLCIHHADFFVVLLFPTALVFLAEPSTLASKVLSSPSFLWAGEISYSLYLLHQLAGDFSTFFLTRILHLEVSHEVLWYALALTSAFLAASVSYHFVEKPARSKIRMVLDALPLKAQLEPAKSARKNPQQECAKPTSGDTRGDAIAD